LAAATEKGSVVKALFMSTMPKKSRSNCLW
jgi:hypothetical protein